MLKGLLFIVLLGNLSCAHAPKSIEAPQTQTYLTDSREDFMLKFESTGSPCLDALQINMASVGCSELQVGQGDEDELLYFRCAGGSSGATDAWSNSTFVVLPTMAAVPDYIYVICVDPMNVLGVLED